MSKKNPEQFFKDMEDWQSKQYMPGAYTGSDMPFPIKQLGKKKWFRRYAAVYLIIFFAILIIAFVQMIVAITRNP